VVHPTDRDRRELVDEPSRDRLVQRAALADTGLEALGLVRATVVEERDTDA
jgi:hypothetical protein